jgi:mannose-6-phosphate isomerase-like protein (cupin superfamily)
MNQDVLYLIPGGYPVTIDVAQASIAGVGTAMHFVLPQNGHNLPLMHHHESKLLVALQGALEIRGSGHSIAVLQQGQALMLPAGTAHRVHQHGTQPVTVGVALWPGEVEQAFRQQAAAVVNGTYDREEMIRIFARFDVIWNAATPAATVAGDVRPLAAWLDELPPALAEQLHQRWTNEHL